MHGEKSRLSVLTATFATVGVAAGIVRFLQLEYGFEASSGLPVYGSPYGTVLAIMSLLVLAAGGLLTLFFKKQPPSLQPGSVGGVPLVLLMISAFFACIGGALYAVMNLSPMDMFGVLMGIFLLVSGLALLHSVRTLASNGEPNGIMLLPVLWGCLELMMTYRDLSRSAAATNYSYVVFGIIALILLFFSAAACVYRPGSYVRLTVTALLSLFFTGLSGIGGLISWTVDYGIGAFGSATAVKYLVIPSFTMLYAFFAALGMLTLFLRPQRPSVEALIEETAEE